jgi:hypothetical protein
MDDPSVDDLAALKHSVPSWPINADLIDACRFWNNLKYRFSAAAGAIHFLQNTVESVRTRIRKIILHEDPITVAWPECHAQGLIPFCQESPRLKIERRVNLWRNALHGDTDPLYILREQSPQIIRRVRADCLRAEDVTRSIAPWVMEALALPSLGMPADAFTLILDGDPLPEKSEQVFEVIRRDAAWQGAYKAHCLEKHVDWFKTRKSRYRSTGCYITSEFPQVMRDITSGDCIVKFNFEIPQSRDVDEIREKGRGWSLEEWASGWKEHSQLDYHTDPPLPSWLDHRREDVISE